MNYKTRIKIIFEEDITELSSRLDMWSKKYNFKLINDNDEVWKYQRGNHFRASCSFDVRYVPTTVIIEYLKEEKQLVCSFHSKSFFYHAMPTDNSRVDEQMELLIAYLKGTFENI